VRARIENQVLFLQSDDLPPYKKKGSVVRNTYFWALKAIAGNTPYSGDWEYESEVWVALQRILISFAESGYLGLRETILEFPYGEEVPETLRSVCTWISEEDWLGEAEAASKAEEV
jgi:hypothetical protein